MAATLNLNRFSVHIGSRAAASEGTGHSWFGECELEKAPEADARKVALAT